MAYLKPQSPIKLKDTDYIYPLTTADQVILDDGTRLDTNLDSIVYISDTNEDIFTAPVDADTLGGNSSNYYAKATKLTPRNLLDNSDFSNPVAQAGLNGVHGSSKYVCDRWFSGATAEQHDDFLRINTTAKSGQLKQNLDIKLQNKPITIACKANANKTFYVGLYYNVDGTTKSIAFSSESGVNGIVCKTGTVPANAENLNYRIYPAYVDDGGSADIYWAALYEGTYTAETLPEYQPKGYGVELAECQRYYIPLGIGQVWSYLSSATLFEGNGTFDVHISTPVQMRIKPTVRIVGAVRIMPSATDITNIFTKTIISNGVVLTVEAQGVSAGSFGLIQQNEGGYMELSADL